MQKRLITSTGTGIGKTLVTTALIHQLRIAGRRVSAIKPLISGFDEMDAHSDTALILKALGADRSLANVEAISPWRFAAPLSPHLAARAEGRSVDYSALLAFCRSQEQSADEVILLEGAGGIMTPVDERRTFLDLAADLAWPVVLVSGTYLGAISHMLTALHVLRAHGVPLGAVVISEASEPALSLLDAECSVRAFAGEHIDVYTVPRVSGSGDAWRHVPLLTDICC
jgi:dethiobiotin synthetase